MLSLSISFLICREGHAYLVLGRVCKESVNRNSPHGLASPESYCLPTEHSREKLWCPPPLPNTGRWASTHLSLCPHGWVSAPSSSGSDGVNCVSRQDSVSQVDGQHGMTLFSSFTHCSVGRRFVHCFFRQPAC